ncbi:MAG: rRNA pseudouridine synthase [Oscillospiraceae bacterium]|nr:rRNA pseudouridine synthase [Oscillospiraceae bacterium]
MRLDKYISDSTPYSRKEIKKLIKYGAITVNGIIAARPEMQVTENDSVAIDGEDVSYAKYVYLILNKPQGYISATEDKHYPVVTELVSEEYLHYNVFPVGRLDIDTEGLLILTNDGAFDHAVTSPKKNVYKRYFARLDKPVEPEDIDVFAEGMTFKEFTAKPARLEICENPNEAYVEIAEGKFHQVKRMFERVGKTVTYLKRVSIGGLTLPDGLEPGEVMEFDENELKLLIFGNQEFI